MKYIFLRYNAGGGTIGIPLFFKEEVKLLLSVDPDGPAY